MKYQSRDGIEYRFQDFGSFPDEVAGEGFLFVRYGGKQEFVVGHYYKGLSGRFCFQHEFNQEKPPWRTRDEFVAAAIQRYFYTSGDWTLWGALRQYDSGRHEFSTALNWLERFHTHTIFNDQGAGGVPFRRRLDREVFAYCTTLRYGEVSDRIRKGKICWDGVLWDFVGPRAEILFAVHFLDPTAVPQDLR